MKDEDSYFIFPELSEDMTKTVFGEATNVHVQVMCVFNYQRATCCQLLVIIKRVIGVITWSKQYLFDLIQTLFYVCMHMALSG